MERARESVKEGGSAVECVRECVNCGDGEVETYSPVAEDWLHWLASGRERGEESRKTYS